MAPDRRNVGPPSSAQPTALEPLQEPLGSARTGRLLHPDLQDLVRALLQRNPGLLIVTSRQALPDLEGAGALGEQRDLHELARARLLRALLTGPLPPPRPDPEASAAALAGLRKAGTINHLPRALLTAAWTAAVRADPDGARAALDEAMQIAERGPMPLFEADVLLYRARLWLGGPPSRPTPGDAAATAARGQDARAPSYPWPGSPRSDLAARPPTDRAARLRPPPTRTR